MCVVQGDWSEEEVERLSAVYREVCAGASGGDGVEEKEQVKAVMVHFPHRGVRDVTQQLRQEGLLAQRTGRGGGERNEGEEGRSSSKHLHTYMKEV